MWIGALTADPPPNKFGIFQRDLKVPPTTPGRGAVGFSQERDGEKAEFLLLQDFSVGSTWEGTPSAPPLPSQRSQMWNSRLLSSPSPLEGSSSLCNESTAHNPPKKSAQPGPPTQGWHPRVLWSPVHPPPKKSINRRFNPYILQNPAGKSCKERNRALQSPELGANSIHPRKKKRAGIFLGAPKSWASSPCGTAGRELLLWADPKKALPRCSLRFPRSPPGLGGTKVPSVSPQVAANTTKFIRARLGWERRCHQQGPACPQGPSSCWEQKQFIIQNLPYGSR